MSTSNAATSMGPLSLHPLYATWLTIKQRCLNPKNANYKNYGARGIGICEGWKISFVAFVRDVGPKPPGLTLDRMDNDGNYELGNCRWATYKQQAANRRRRPVAS